MSDVVDPYRWLEDLDSPETIAWVAEQNRRSEAFLSSIPQRDEIRARLTALWDHERRSPPSRHGEWYLFSANSGLQPQAVLFKARRLDEPGDVLLDPNTWSGDGTVALAATGVSEDGRMLAYAKSSSGSDWMSWHVRDIATGQDLPDEVRWSKFSGAAWAHDGSGFYYGGYAPPADGNVFTSINTHHMIFFHRLGDPRPDSVVFSRPDHPDWLFAAEVTDDGRFLVITQSQGTHRESRIFVQDLTTPNAPVMPFLDRFDASYSVVDNDADVFHVWTDHAAPRGRLVSIRLGRPEPGAWTTVIAEAAGTDVLSSVARVGEAWIAVWRTDAHERLCVHERDGRLRHEVPLPALGAIPAVSARRAEPDVFFTFASFTYPDTVFRHTVETGVTTLWHQPAVGFGPGDFETRQVFYTSKDGTRVPMFIVHKRGLALQGDCREIRRLGVPRASTEHRSIPV